MTAKEQLRRAVEEMDERQQTVVLTLIRSVASGGPLIDTTSAEPKVLRTAAEAERFLSALAAAPGIFRS